MKRKTLFYIITILASLLLLEILVRVTGKELTYGEQTTGRYFSYYGQHFPTWYWTWHKNEDIVYNQPEIKCSYPANSLGLREVEIPVARKDSSQRLFVIGDSFVEGDGVAYPYSMPRYLEKKLDSAGLKFEVYDAGSCGSDPLYEYTLLRDKLLPYKPTHVILCINSSDVLDCVYRGGMERFHADGTTQFKPGPCWEPVFVHWQLFRLVYNTLNPNHNGTFLSETRYRQEKQVADKEINSCLLNMKNLCDKYHIKLVVIVHPFPNTFNGDEINDDMNDVYKKDQHTPFDLINVFDDFSHYLNKNNYLEYGWKINGHYNAKGYHLFSDIIYDKVNKQYPGFWQATP